jgi:DNA topoisomerase-1
LAQPKAQRRGFGARREPLKTFEQNETNPKKIDLLDGRYGLYVTDGTTNASLPKNMSPDELTVEFAQRLLTERAAAGPPKRGAHRGAPQRRAASKSAETKSPAKRAPTKRRAAKKPSTKKRESASATIALGATKTAVLAKKSAKKKAGR